MDIFITSAPCGAGKSHFIQNEIKRHPAKHIVAVPTHRLIDEYKTAFRGMNVFSFGYFEQQGETVSNQINAERQRVENDDHAVFLITHSALLRSLDHDMFKGWNLWIDEVLTLQNQGVHNSTVSKTVLESFYDLEPVGGYSQIRAKDTGITVSDMMADTMLSNLTDLHRRVTDTREKVFTGLKSWDDLDKQTSWYSFSRFDVKRLRYFKKVHMFANAVTETVTYQLLQDDPNVNIIMSPLDVRHWATRPVTVNYFASNHVFSESALNQFAKHNIKLVQKWANRQDWCSSENHFWMTNKSLSGFCLAGDQISPISHGLNTYADRSAVTVLYKSKPSTVERSMFNRLGIDEWRVIAEREHEVIAQTVMRGSIRDATSTTPFIANVYDYTQARKLAVFLRENYKLEVVLNHVEIDGFDDRVMDRKSIRGDAAKTPAERTALKARQKIDHTRRVREARWREAGKDVEVMRKKWELRQASKAAS